jgi:chromosome partitioning protein
MTLILSLLARKGGVGKSTIAVNLAAECALRGLFTVLVETDGQGNASEHMGVTPHDGFSELVLGGRNWQDVLLPVPQTFTGKKVDLFLVSAADLTREVEESPATVARLVKALGALRGWADVVIIDTAPSINSVHVAAYYASDYVILPTLCELDSINSLSKTLRYLEAADVAGKGELTAAKVLGIVPNRYSRGSKVSQLNYGMVLGRFAHEQRVFDPIHEGQVWAYARAQSCCVSAFKPSDSQRESRRIARRDFAPIVESVMQLMEREEVTA